MSDAVRASERRLLRAVAAHPAVPAALRRLVARIEASDLGYRLAHGAFWSLSGTAASRVLALAASVVTARLLGKTGYGQLGVLTSTLMTLQAFAGLGLGMTATKYVAELRERDPARAGRILALSLVVSAVAGVAAALGLWASAPWLAARTIAAPELAGPLRIAAVGVVFTTVGAAQAGALAGLEAFRTTSVLNVWSGVIGVVTTIAGVWLWGLDGAIGATVVTAAAQYAIARSMIRTHARRAGLPVGLEGWWREQRVLWSFALPGLVQGIMVTPVTWAAQAILVNQPLGYPEMGALSAANQWYGAVLFLPTALGGAVLPVLSERIGRGDTLGARTVLRAAIGLNGLAVLPVVAVGCAASRWIMGLYGPGFAVAWPTLVAVLLTAGLVAAMNPIGTLLAASNRLWLGFVMNSGWATAFLLLTWGWIGAGAFGVAGARLAAYVVHGAWTVWFAWRCLRPSPAPSPAPGA